MAFRHREDDGFASAREAPDAVPAREAVLQHVAELAHDGAIAFRDGELALQRPWIDVDNVRLAEQLLELCPRGGVHRAPVKLVAAHLEAALGRGLDRHRPVDAVGGEVTLRDGPAKRVAERRLLGLEEAQGVAHEAPVLGIGLPIGRPCRVRSARGRGQAHLDAIEVPERSAPPAVDRAMALVGNDQIEVARREPAVLRDHGLQGRDGDALGAVESAAGAQHVAGIVAEVVGEGILRLSGERDPVHQEENAGDGTGLEQPLDERHRGAGLSGPRGHLHQELAPAARDLVGQRLDAVDLVAAVHDLPVDRDVDQRTANHPRRDSTFQVFLRIEGGDSTCVSVHVAVHELHLVAVREKHEGDFEECRIVTALVLGGDGLDARALGLDYGHRSPGAVTQHVVRTRAVRQRVLEQDACAVGRIPSGVHEQRVDPDSGECLGGSGHEVAMERRHRPLLDNAAIGIPANPPPGAG